MNICHINLAKEFRGGERQTYLLMKGLAALNIDQTLICRQNSPLAEQAHTIDRLNVREINKPFIFRTREAKHCDLLHAHEGRSCHFAYINWVTTKTPYLITRRIPNLPKKSFPTTHVYKKATKVVALSQAIKSNLIDYQTDMQLEIIPSMRSDLTSNADTINELKNRYAGKTIVGNIGALVKHHKGQQYIIEAAKVLQKSHPNLHFLILGKGNDENELREQTNGLSNIEFVGFVNNVGDYLSIFDLFLFPSLEEGLGSILLDVMQFNVPIIASNVDGIPDIISHNKNGLLVEPKNSHEIVNAITRLIDDSELAKSLSNQALKTVEDYTVDKISKLYLDLYHSIL